MPPQGKYPYSSVLKESAKKKLGRTDKPLSMARDKRIAAKARMKGTK